MARIAYIQKTFKGERADIVDRADEIMREYAAKGYSLTLRQCGAAYDPSPSGPIWAQRQERAVLEAFASGNRRNRRDVVESRRTLHRDS